MTATGLNAAFISAVQHQIQSERIRLQGLLIPRYEANPTFESRDIDKEAEVKRRSAFLSVCENTQHELKAFMHTLHHFSLKAASSRFTLEQWKNMAMIELVLFQTACQNALAHDRPLAFAKVQCALRDALNSGMFTFDKRMNSDDVLRRPFNAEVRPRLIPGRKTGRRSARAIGWLTAALLSTLVAWFITDQGR